MSIKVADIIDLTVSERVKIVEEIWNSIVDNAEQLPISDRERIEIDKRLKKYEKAPNEGIEWKTLKTDLTKAG